MPRISATGRIVVLVSPDHPTAPLYSAVGADATEVREHKEHLNDGEDRAVAGEQVKEAATVVGRVAGSTDGDDESDQRVRPRSSTPGMP
ncbi:hypothetical protein KXR83_06925 [Williamsia muralis]|uniref:hypothetical protein n=1 Tax=Williamsia marianensis TaxID=85044 RepID=UPI003F156E24